MEAELRNRMHGCSNLAIAATKYAAPPLVLDNDRDILQNLTSLAFLLAPEPGQRAATSAWRSSSTMKIIWTRNVAVEAADLEYIETLICRMRTDSPCRHSIDALIPKSRLSIRKCTEDLAKAFGPIAGRENLWQIDEQQRQHQDLKKLLINSNLLGPSKSLASCLDSFLTKLAHFEELSDDQIHHVLVFSGFLVKSGKLRHFVKPEKLEAFKELGRYYVAVNEVRTAFQALDKQRIKLDLEHLSGPEAHFRAVNSATVNALAFTSAASPDSSSEEPSITFDQISTLYPHASPGIIPNREITLPFQQHPTVTVCVRSMKQKLKKIYIGVSDYSCCKWCEDWAEAVSSALPMKVNLWRSRGEYPSNWHIPEEVPIAVTEAMAKAVKDKIETMLVEPTYVVDDFGGYYVKLGRSNVYGRHG